MGIRGLKTYLNDNRQSLCRTISFPPGSAANTPSVPVVVDAWGLIFSLYLSSLPWASGGEYLHFYRLVRRFVIAWRRAGITLSVVFDGVAPPEKHDTCLSRMNEQVSFCSKFYNTDEATRSGPGFGGKVILPCFAWDAFVAALHSLDVATHFVADGEADAMCVVLAEREGGFILGNDSDFVILAAGARGVQGYAPLDEVQWVGYDSAPPRYGRRNTKHSRLLPPSTMANPTLVLETYSVAVLCRHLKLPGTRLSLLGALVGNDYSPPLDVFFPRPTPSAPGSEWESPASTPLRSGDRIERVASALRNLPSALDQTPEILVEAAIDTLLTCPLSAIARKELIEGVTDATVQYALPRGQNCCRLHPFCGTECDTTPLHQRPVSSAPPNDEGPLSASVAYAAAQQRGSLNTITKAWLYPDRVYLWQFIENPECTAVFVGARSTHARYAAYAILDEALGGLRWDAEDEGDWGSVGQQANEDSGSNPTDIDAESQDRTTNRQHLLRTVTEYVRLGEGRITARTAQLPCPKTRIATTPMLKSPSSTPDLSEAVTPVSSSDSPLLRTPPPSSVPTCFLPLEERLALCLNHMGASNPAIVALSTDLQPLAAALRLCLLSAAEAHAADFATQPNNLLIPDRRWRRSELAAIVCAAIGCLSGWAREDTDGSGDDHPPIVGRHAHLVAQLAGALSDGLALAQALLLPTPNLQGRPDTTHTVPFVFISGVALHTLLTNADTNLIPTPPHRGTGWRWLPEDEGKADALIGAVLEGLEGVLAPERVRRMGQGTGRVAPAGLQQAGPLRPGLPSLLSKMFNDDGTAKSPTSTTPAPFNMVTPVSGATPTARPGRYIPPHLRRVA